MQVRKAKLPSKIFTHQVRKWKERRKREKEGRKREGESEKVKRKDERI